MPRHTAHVAAGTRGSKLVPELHTLPSNNVVSNSEVDLKGGGDKI